MVKSGGSFSLFCTFTATHLIYAWADAYIYRPITMQNPISRFPTQWPHGLFWKNTVSWIKPNISQTLEQKEGRLDALEIHYQKRRYTLYIHAKTKPKTNLVIITVSVFHRQDAIKAETTPRACNILPKMPHNIPIITASE